jgi:hypothetical protein
MLVLVENVDLDALGLGKAIQEHLNGPGGATLVRTRPFPPGVALPGVVSCGRLSLDGRGGDIEGGLDIFGIVDPGLGASYRFTLVETPIPVAIPDPATLGLLGTGLLAVSLLRHPFRSRPYDGLASPIGAPRATEA